MIGAVVLLCLAVHFWARGVVVGGRWHQALARVCERRGKGLGRVVSLAGDLSVWGFSVMGTGWVEDGRAWVGGCRVLLFFSCICC